MDMQDKEFDELFRAKLDGFEAEPSANVWPGIADELDSNKRRKTLINPFCSISSPSILSVAYRQHTPSILDANCLYSNSWALRSPALQRFTSSSIVYLFSKNIIYQ